jgi:hypothetical protein
VPAVLLDPALARALLNRFAVLIGYLRVFGYANWLALRRPTPFAVERALGRGAITGLLVLVVVGVGEVDGRVVTDHHDGVGTVVVGVRLGVWFGGAHHWAS